MTADANDDGALIGVDLGRGSGALAIDLPCRPFPLILCRADEGAGIIPATLTVDLDIMGLDPRLNLALTFERVQSPTRTATLPATNITAAITAYILSDTTDGIKQGAPLPVSSLMLNSGALDGAGTDDGCELANGAQGVRFHFIFTRTAGFSVDTVAAIQARPNVALGCEKLARKLFRLVTISTSAKRAF